MKAGKRAAVQDQLLAEIRAIKSAPDVESQAQALDSTFRKVSQRCADPTSTRIDLDDFGQWISTAKSVLPVHCEFLARLLDERCQSKLVSVLWEKVAAIGKRAEPVLQALLTLLNAIAAEQHGEHSSDLPHMARLLFDRATQDVETRTSLVVYDLMLSVYDAEVVLTRYPSLYSDLIHKFSAQIDIPTRRSRVCMKILRSNGERLGLIFEPKEIKQDTPPPAAAVWKEWSDFAVAPMKDALLSHDPYKRSSTSVYHLTELFQLAPASLLPLTAALLAHQDASQSLPAILSTLRAAKQFGSCRVGSKAEHPLEALLGTEVLKLAKDFHGHPAMQPLIVAPPEILAACVQTNVEELQVAALSIVVESRSSVAPLTPEEISVLHTFLQASLSSTHASGRGSLNGLFGKLLVRMSGIGYAAERELTKLEARQDTLPEDLQPHQYALQSSRDFIQSAAQMIFEAIHPGAPYHAIITALTFLEIMLNCGVDTSFDRDSTALKSAFGKFAQDYSLKVPIISPRAVRILLSCTDSTYDDIQVRALGILHRFPAPLPGLEDRASAENATVFKARDLLLSGRESESEAAGCLLRVYQQVYVRRMGWLPTSLLANRRSDKSAAPSTVPTSRELALFSDLLGFLEAQIAVAEKQNLLTAAKAHPLHGSLVTLQKMLDDKDFWAATSPEFAGQVRQQFLRAQSLIDRIWNVTQPILCATAPEGNTNGTGDAADASNDTEVARAIAAAEGHDSGAAMTESVIRKSQLMLSYSWRGMKEAAALLGKLVSSPMQKGSETAKLVWTDEEIDQVGSRFTLWMTAVRHRGAFSTIYPAYSSAAAAILRCDWPEVKTRPHAWLNSFITKVTSADNRVSTTRRSAGIGYAVLALVTALPLRQDRVPLDGAVNQLIEASNECFGKTDEEIVAAHIHALNILRVLVEDSSLAEAMHAHVDTLMSLAIRRFQSSIWYIRNAALMLFSALAPRVFPSRKTNEDDPSNQLPANRFFQMYPTLYPTLTDNLSQSLKIGLHKTANAADAEQAGSLYAVLFLLSRMQAVEHQEITSADLIALRDLVAQCLTSTDFKIREIAARAFGALTTAKQASSSAAKLLDELSTANENAWHGNLLAVARLSTIHGSNKIAHERLESLHQSDDAREHSPAVLEALETALKRTASSAASRQDTSMSVEDLRRRLWDDGADFQVRTDAADELYDRYAELDVSKLDLGLEWENAAALALTSSRIPLREAVLTLLGHLTNSVVASMSTSAVFKSRAVTIFSRLACLCSREEEHVESRLSAVQALAAFGPQLFSADQGISKLSNASKPMFNARIALMDLLQDDEEEVRLIAADVIARTLTPQAESSEAGGRCCSLRGSLLTAAKSAASSTLSTDRVWSWMSTTYGLSNENLWTRYLCTTILPLDREVTEALDTALNPSSALFAAERPNIFRDREMEVVRACKLVRSNEAAQQYLTMIITKRVKARINKIKEWLKVLLDHPDAMRSVAGRLVAFQLCSAVEVARERTGELGQLVDSVRDSLNLAE